MTSSTSMWWARPTGWRPRQVWADGLHQGQGSAHEAEVHAARLAARARLVLAATNPCMHVAARTQPVHARTHAHASVSVCGARARAGD